MRQKTAVVVGFLLLAMIVVVYVATANEELLGQPFDLLGARMPTAAAMALALLSGFVVFALWAAASGLSRLAGRWLQDLRKSSEREAEEKYLKGLDAVLGGRPLEAINHFRRSLEAQPEYLPALLKLGDALRRLGRLDEAVELHRRALLQRPEDLPVLYALVDDYLALADHEQAKRCLASILKIQPRRALHAYRTLRELYIKEGNWKKALEVQERIAEARVLEEERAQDAAYGPGILYAIGADLAAQEKHTDAAAHLEKVRKKHPAFIPTYLKLAESYLLLGREDRAVEVYLDGYRRAGSATCLLSMERVFVEKGAPEEAVARYQAVVATTDRKLLPKFLLALLYYRLEMMEKAEVMLREIEGGVRQSGIVQYYLGRIRERRGDTARACSHYREVIRVLKPFELSFACAGCGDRSPQWKDFCPKCLQWGTWAPEFKDELMQELQESRPVYYQADADWDRSAGAV
jgi:lipopolysaccharide biosynthesis regulator YciM